MVKTYTKYVSDKEIEDYVMNDINYCMFDEFDEDSDPQDEEYKQCKKWKKLSKKQKRLFLRNIMKEMSQKEIDIIIIIIITENEDEIERYGDIIAEICDKIKLLL